MPEVAGHTGVAARSHRPECLRWRTRGSQQNGDAVAQKIQTVFIDDLDGSGAGGTVRFGLDGTAYEIDLNAGHAQALRDALARYVRAARRAGGAVAAPPAAGAARRAAH